MSEGAPPRWDFSLRVEVPSPLRERSQRHGTARAKAALDWPPVFHRLQVVRGASENPHD
jgi:hypothetical protein